MGRGHQLYIVRFLHQTTTSIVVHYASCQLYIVRFLHQTTTKVSPTFKMLLLYIVRFLHQTTTMLPWLSAVLGCISSVSYIKPQPDDGI